MPLYQFVIPLFDRLFLCFLRQVLVPCTFISSITLPLLVVFMFVRDLSVVIVTVISPIT